MSKLVKIAEILHKRAWYINAMNEPGQYKTMINSENEIENYASDMMS